MERVTKEIQGGEMGRVVKWVILIKSSITNTRRENWTNWMNKKRNWKRNGR